MSKYLDYDGLSHFKDKCDDAYADTLGTGYVKAAFTPDLNVGYGFSGFTQWGFNIPITEDLTLAITWIDTSTNTTYSCIGVTYNDGSEYGITVNAMTVVTTPGDGLYEHRIAYRSENSITFDIQFTFINNVSTPYISEDMDDDELTEGVENLYNALIAIMNEGDYINSDITDRWIPCIASSDYLSTSPAFYAFRPTTCNSGSLYITLFGTEGAEVTAFLMNFVGEDVRPDFEDNVRMLSDGTILSGSTNNLYRHYITLSGSDSIWNVLSSITLYTSNSNPFTNLLEVYNETGIIQIIPSTVTNSSYSIITTNELYFYITEYPMGDTTYGAIECDGRFSFWADSDFITLAQSIIITDVTISDEVTQIF